MKKILVTGGAGFIGSHLIKRLLDEGNFVICVDNFALGCQENISDFNDNSNFCFILEDVVNIDKLLSKLSSYDIDIIYHLAANSDIQKGGKNPEIDFHNTLSTTFSALEIARRLNVKEFFFASTSAIYGDRKNEDLSESLGDLRPISYYGGCKLASEALISSYAHMNDMKVIIFRFPNVIGPNLTHGVIYDFVKKLHDNPRKLEILGDGTQTKPYIYVEDLIDAIMKMTSRINKGVDVYNIGVDGSTSVTKIADIICEVLGLDDVEYNYTGGSIGWKGDVSRFQYDLTKIHDTGWSAKYDSDEAVKMTVKSLKKKDK